MPTCSESLLNEALLPAISDRAPKRMMVVRKGDKPWFDDRCVLVHRAKQRVYIGCRVVAGRMLIGRSIEWLD